MSVNKVILIGNLGRDPEVRYMPNGTAVVNLALATSRTWKDKQSGERQEETEWHRLVAYDRLAEIMGEYLKKGSKIYAEGRLKTRKWEKEGVDMYTTEIIVDEMKMLDGKRDGDGGQGDGGGQRQQRESGGNSGQQQRSSGNASGDRQQRPQASGQQQRQAPRSNTGFDDMDDDIPF